MRDAELRIELDCTLETFDGLSQTFRGTTSRIVTSGGVKLSRFLVFTGPSFGRRREYLSRNRWNVCARSAAALCCAHGSRSRLFAIERRMSQVAQDAFESRLASQRIKLRLNTKPHHPRISYRVGFE